MSTSFPVECPQCHVRGELSDPGLIGKAISCPSCRFVFTISAPVPVESVSPPAETVAVVPASTEMTPAPEGLVVASTSTPGATDQPPVELETSASDPVLDDDASTSEVTAPATLETPTLAVAATATPVTPSPVAESVPPVVSAVPAWPTVTASAPVPSPPPLPNVPVIGPIDQPQTETPIDPNAFAFAAKEMPASLRNSTPTGAAEFQFAESLPQPSNRGSLGPRKEASKTTSMIVAIVVSSIVVFAVVMFLMGDPSRNLSKRHDEDVARDEARKKEQSKPRQRATNDTSYNDALKKLQEMNAKSGQSK